MWKGWIAPFFPWPNLCFFSTCCDRLYRTRLPGGYKGFLTAVSRGARLTTKHLLCGICQGEWCGWCGWLGKPHHPPWPWMPVEFVKVENWPPKNKIYYRVGWWTPTDEFLLWDTRRGLPFHPPMLGGKGVEITSQQEAVGWTWGTLHEIFTKDFSLVPNTILKRQTGWIRFRNLQSVTHRIHVWYIYLHFP